MPTLAELLGQQQQPQAQAGPMSATQNPQLMAIIQAALRRRQMQPQPQMTPVAPMIGVRG